MEYTWADAWLLQSIARASLHAPANLKDIIMTGDALNHAIFTAGELQQGIYKLSSDGFIRCESGHYSVHDKSKGLIQNLLSRNKTPMKEMDAIGKLLNAKPYDSKYKSPMFEDDPKKRFFSIEDYNKASKAYTKQFWDKYRSLKDKNG